MLQTSVPPKIGLAECCNPHAAFVPPSTSPLPRYASIHQEAPEFVEMNVEQEILETGIKVVDLLAPYAKGGKIGEGWGEGEGGGGRGGGEGAGGSLCTQAMQVEEK